LLLQSRPFIAPPGSHGAYSQPDSTTTDVIDGQLVCMASRQGRGSSIVWGLLLGPGLLAVWATGIGLPQVFTDLLADSLLCQVILGAVILVSTQGLIYSCLSRRQFVLCPDQRMIRLYSRVVPAIDVTLAFTDVDRLEAFSARHTRRTANGHSEESRSYGLRLLTVDGGKMTVLQTTGMSDLRQFISKFVGICEIRLRVVDDHAASVLSDLLRSEAETAAQERPTEDG
jgi:hypothetical protein